MIWLALAVAYLFGIVWVWSLCAIAKQADVEWTSLQMRRWRAAQRRGLP